MKKTLDFYCFFFTSFDFLSLKNDVYVLLPPKMNKHKNLGKKLIFCWRLEGHQRKEEDLEPDPFVKGTGIRGS
jgi:hypothetical protein